MRWTEFRGTGFWSRDGLVEIWLAALVDEIDRSGSTPSDWLVAMRNDWLSQASVTFDGLMESRLDDHIDGERKCHHAIALCRSVRDQLQRGQRPDGPQARRIGGPRLQRDDAPEGLMRVAGSFLWLLESG
jgi:hypothetical protein